MVQRPHWSYSSISQYLSCPLRFYFQRIVGMPQPSVSSSLILGSAVHHALAKYHLGVQMAMPLTKDRVHNAFREGWKQKAANAIVIFKEGETRDELIALGIGLLDVYLQEEPPERILAIEEEFVVPLITSQGEYLETPLVAIADLIIRVDDGLKVCEYKTSGRAYSEMEAATSLQPTCYAHAVQETFGESTRVEYTILVKTKTPRVQRLETVRHPEDVERLGDIVQGIERAIAADAFYPVESALNCSNCPYRTPCREWQGSVRRTTRSLDVINPEPPSCSPNSTTREAESASKHWKESSAAP